MARLQTKILLVLSLTGLATTIGFGAFLINSKTIEASYGVNENLKPVAYIEGSNVQYSSIEKALEVANDLARSGTIQNVYVIPGTNPTISRQCKVGNNVNLILPYEGTTYYNESTGSSSEYNGANYADNNPERFRKNSVTIQKCEQDGVTVPTIIVETGGTINIGGFRGYLPQGSTNGNYCELVMEQDALIECDGTINCYGYIKEASENNNSLINVSSNGKVSQPLLAYDWGSAGYALAANTEHIFPFNLFDLPQISPKIRFYNGSQLNAMVWIYGNTAGDKKSDALIIGGNQDTALIKSSPNAVSTSYIDWKNTDKSSGTQITKTTNNHLMDIDINGKYFLDKLVVNVGMEVDSSDFILPFSNIFDISLEYGSEFNINNPIKFLPGSKIFVKRGATANINSTMVVYDSNKSPENKTIYKYSKSDPATFVNEGGINITENGYFGGKIQAGSKGDTSTYVSTSQNVSNVVSNEITGYESIIGGLFSRAVTTQFSYYPIGDIKLALDVEKYENDAIFESNKTYTYWKNDNQYYWVADGYVVNFIIEDTTTSNNQTILTPNYNVEITRVKDGTVETISNPDYVRVYDGDFIKIVPLDDNIDEILIDGVEANDELNTPIEINNSSLDVTIKPKVIEASEIANVVIEWSSDGTSWNSNPYDGDAATLYLRANITTVNEDSYYSPLTTFQWKVDDKVLSDTASSISYAFSNNNEYNVSLTVADGLNQTPHTDELRVTTSCITGDTLVLMADYTYKEVRFLNIGDKLICYDHEKGQLIENVIMANIHLDDNEKELKNVIVLEFENKTNINIVMEHGLFDLTLNKYVMINNDTYLDYVDHDFAYLDINTKQFISVKLIKASIELKEIDVYSPVTIYHLNHIANNFLAFPGDLPGFYNQFTFKNLKYDEELMKQDIQKYGLLSYEDLCKEVMLPYEVYQVFPLLYYRIAVKKGLTTFDELRRIVKAYLPEFLSKFNK